jgi:pimeloyl-ACP methyl ester carboxylesterase
MTLLKALATFRFAQEDRAPAEVRPGLWLGSIGAAENEEFLRGSGITHVLSLGGSEMLANLRAVPSRAQATGLNHRAVEVGDKSSDALLLDSLIDSCILFIDEALAPRGLAAASASASAAAATSTTKGGILVHCFQGKSRSAAVVAAWLMKRERLSYEEALESLRSVRPRACPNIGFALQLRKRGHDRTISAGRSSGGSLKGLLVLFMFICIAAPASPLGLQGGGGTAPQRLEYTYGGRRCSYFFSPARENSDTSRDTAPLPPPLLCVHPVGVGCSSWFFKRFAAAWRDHPGGGSALLCPDLLGCGDSSRWDPSKDGIFVPLDWTRQLEQLIVSDAAPFPHGLAQPSFMVISQGGLAPVGIQLAYRCPRVGSLVLCTPPSYGVLARELPKKEVARNLAALQALPKFAFEFLASRGAIKFFSNLFLFSGSADEEWLNEATADAADYERRHSIWAFNAGCCEVSNYAEMYSNLEQPRLVVMGCDDGGASSTKGLEAEAAWQHLEPFEDGQNARGVVLRGGKNVLPWENPEMLCDILAGFAKENQAPGVG